MTCDVSPSIYDTMSHTLKELPTGDIRIYLCGVTVYDDTHIGHARTIILFDVLRRYLLETGRRITMIQNFTDVDDKIIGRALSEGIEPSSLAGRYIHRYHEEFERLHVMPADAYPLATAHIPHMIHMIKGLIRTGHAYVTDSGVYYMVASFEGYGKLSDKDTEGLWSGARIEPHADKADPADFALWKCTDIHPAWDSPWGKGRPGWHIECSAMSLEYLGETFDIHGGGRDLIFPHHENEIAQSEGYTGRQPADIWMHTGMVTISGQKMSKSLGNVVATRALLEQWGSNALRLFCLSGHYRKPIDYTNQMLSEALSLWCRIETAWHILSQTSPATHKGKAWKEFITYLSYDMDTHGAISCMARVARQAGAAASGKLDAQEAGEWRADLEGMMDILGLYMGSPPIDVRAALYHRDTLRGAGRYKEADDIRDELSSHNIELLDYPGHTIWVYHERGSTTR